MKEFQMTDEQYQRLLDASNPKVIIYMTGEHPFSGSSQVNIRDEWKKLGAELGFDETTVKPVDGKSEKFFTATSKR